MHYLNCFLRKIVSTNTVNGMIASLVICKLSKENYNIDGRNPTSNMILFQDNYIRKVSILDRRVILCYYVAYLLIRTAIIKA